MRKKQNGGGDITSGQALNDEIPEALENPTAADAHVTFSDIDSCSAKKYSGRPCTPESSMSATDTHDDLRDIRRVQEAETPNSDWSDIQN